MARCGPFGRRWPEVEVSATPATQGAPWVDGDLGAGAGCSRCSHSLSLSEPEPLVESLECMRWYAGGWRPMAAQLGVPGRVPGVESPLLLSMLLEDEDRGPSTPIRVPSSPRMNLSSLSTHASW